MTLYVNISRRKVKFKLRNKLINAVAAAGETHAARWRQRTPVCANWKGALRLTNSYRRGARISLSTVHGGGIGANELNTRCPPPSEAEKRKGNYTINFLKYFKYNIF